MSDNTSPVRKISESEPTTPPTVAPAAAQAVSEGTPRTEEALHHLYSKDFPPLVIFADFARTLERELAAQSAKVAELTERLTVTPYAKLRETEQALYVAERNEGNMRKELDGEKVIRLRHVAELAALRAQLREAREALEGISHDTTTDEDGTWPTSSAEHAKKTLAALATPKAGEK